MSHRARLITALTVCVLPLAGCSANVVQEASAPSGAAAPATGTLPRGLPAPEVPGDGTFPQVADVDRTDVESTARTAAVLLHSWDTAVDRTETAAAIRATPLFSEEWAEAQVEPARNSSHGHWLGPSQHRAYSRAQTVPAIGDASADVGKDRAVRAYEVSWRWASRDGEPVPGTGSRQVTLYLEKHSGVWEVVGHQFHGVAAGEAGS